MFRKPTILASTCLLALALGMAPAAAQQVTPSAEPANNNVPGDPLTPTPVSAWLDLATDADDVFSVTLNAGEILRLNLQRGASIGTFEPDLYLYAPGTRDIVNESPIVGAEGIVFPKSITYEAPQSGTFYINIHEPARAAGSGDVVLSWSVSAPVYRFYNFTNNTHFFTPSAAERDMVMARWPGVYAFEGPAYYTNPANNTTPLIRFYNQVSRSHFYTSSTAEANAILARWPHIFLLDGQTYAVNPGPAANSLPVWRFYNKSNGSHFYTASWPEAQHVSATWPHIYAYEGPAFWIGQ